VERLAGKVALVTGGTSGIGAATALRLAAQGARVMVCGRAPDELAAALESFHASGAEITGAVADVSRPEDLERLAAEALAMAGGVDILVNSAGVNTSGTVVDTTPERWAYTLAVNLTAPFLLSQKVIPSMRERGSGAIVHVSSVQAFVTRKAMAPYVASKGGLNALTRAMAVDHGPDNIRVNALCPASIDTSMLREGWRAVDADLEVMRRRVSARYPLRRIGTPEDCAAFVEFLVGPGGEFLSGQCYVVDGGLLATSPIVLEADA